jgi:hypothetical protein
MTAAAITTRGQSRNLSGNALRPARDVRSLACDTDGVSTHVTLSGQLSGDYVVLEDGRVILRPDTSATAIRTRAGLEQISDEEFAAEFGHLPTDDEE